MSFDPWLAFLAEFEGVCAALEATWDRELTESEEATAMIHLVRKKLGLSPAYDAFRLRKGRRKKWDRLSS